MIVFDLRCDRAHVFEAWFGSTADYEAQHARGLVACPICGSDAVTKAAMAAAIPAKGRSSHTPAQVKAALLALATAQAEMVAGADDVGRRFAVEARAIHDGDAEARSIVGEATRAEAAGLADDGIAVTQLPFPTRRLN